jgi:biopolymer transport protein ExbB/TolQ
MIALTDALTAVLPAPQYPMPSFLSLFRSTGIVGVLLLIVAAVGLTMAVRRWLELQLTQLAPLQLQKSLELLVRGGQVDAAAQQAEASRTCLGAMVSGGLRLRRAGLDEMLANVERVAMKESLRLGNRIANLSRLGGSILLLGVLGTIASLINTMSIIQMLKNPQVWDFAAGIGGSLMCVGVALFVALGSYVAYFWLDSRLVRHTLLVREIAEELVYAVPAPPPA